MARNRVQPSPPIALRDEAPRVGGPAVMTIGQDGTPTAYTHRGDSVRKCSECGTTEGRLLPVYWGTFTCPACGQALEAAFELEGWPRPWWEAPEAPHVAVACAGGIFHGQAIVPLAYTIAELGELCFSRGISQLWVHESAMDELALPAKPGAGHRLVEESGPYKTSSGRPVLSPYSKWWIPKGFGFTVHIPAYENDSAFARLESGYHLLCAVAWYEHSTRRSATWIAGGSITSDAWIRHTYQSKRRRDLAPTEHPEPINTGAAREARFYWSRPAAAFEQNYRYCHALDLNLAYAAVSSSLQLPVGPVEFADFPTFDKRVPGLWLIEPDPWVDPLMPAPWADDHRRDDAGAYWVTTPTMELLAPYGVEAIEAWTWPEHHAYLRPWYELIRDARTELLDVGGPALAAVKEISRRGVGRLASRQRTKDLEGDELFQPYWSWAVIAECRARLWRRLRALGELKSDHPIAPIAIDTDAVYFLSSRATPEILAVRLGLPLGDGLGQFKGAGTCSGADARDALELRGRGQSITRLRKLVKA